MHLSGHDPGSVRHVRGLIKWWTGGSNDRARYARISVGVLLVGWIGYELALGTARWWVFVQLSPWWALFFPVAIPLLSLRAAPALMMLHLVPLIFDGTDNHWTKLGLTLACSILAFALAAAIPVIQHYVELFLMVWF